MNKAKDTILIKNGNKELHRNYKDHEKVLCPICSQEIHPYWEPRYNGIRATCSECGTNWQES